MVFTGELEQLHIVDIIQLLNTTRKSGTFSVRGQKGESRIIFSNGYIVGANHLNNRVRIGSVLVKMEAVTGEDLRQALDVQKKAGKGRKPLINTLIELGKLGREDAARGLKKLIEITLVELIGWKSGTFTLDSDVVSVSPECSYPLSAMEQEISLDAQMLLMDALRIYDERERDRQAGKAVTPDEELFSEVAPSETQSEREVRQVITADDLGLGNLDQLERKMPEFVPEDEVFDPVEIHRQKIKETLSGFPEGDRETFVSFLERSAASRIISERTPRKEERAKGIILFSEDEFITHSVMTICKAEGVVVFATDGEEELLRIIEQCIKIGVLPVLIFDDPGTSEGFLSREKIVSLRQRVQARYPQVPFIQAASVLDYDFLLQSYRDGAKAVFPKPCLKEGKTTKFVGDAIAFFEVLRPYVTRFSPEQKVQAPVDNPLRRLRESVLALRDSNSADPSLVLLRFIADICERAITFVVRQSELAGEKAIGVFAGKDEGPTSVTRLKIPLAAPSVFRDVLEKGTVYCGKREDDILREHLFDAIGEPLDPAIILVPVKSRGDVVMLIYGDFAATEASIVPADLLEILANQAGMALENAFYHKQIIKGSRK